MLSLVLVFASLPGPSVVSMVVNQPVEIIRGKPSKKVTAKPVPTEPPPQTVQDRSQQQAKSDALDQKAAELARKEKALDEKQQASDDKDKAQAEKQKALQKRIEQIGQENQAAFGAAADALSGN